MSKKCLIFLSLLTLAALAIWGCSDSSTKTEGSLSDQEFVLMDQIMSESMMQFNIEALRLSLNLTDSVAMMSEKPRPLLRLNETSDDILSIDELSYVYDDQNYWHIFTVSANVISSDFGGTDSLSVSGVDSIRFRNDGTPVRFPDEDSTDEINSRVHFDMDAFGSLGETFSFMHHASFDITGGQFDLDIFTLDGATSDSVDVSFDDYEGLSCDIFLNSDQTYTDILFNGDLECPESGSSAVVAVVDMSCSDSTGNFALNGTWTGDYTFEGDSVSVLIESGGNRWSYSEACYAGGDPYSVKR